MRGDLGRKDVDSRHVVLSQLVCQIVAVGEKLGAGKTCGEMFCGNILPITWSSCCCEWL